MHFQVNAVVTMFGLWWASAALCHAQATFEAKRLSPLEMKAEIEEQNRRLREASAKFKQPIETGVSVFVFGKNKSEKATEYGKPYSGSPLDTKAPEDFLVGDWGRPSTQAAVFTVVQKVEDDALLIQSKKGAWFWLQGVDMSKAAEGMQFMLPRIAMITGTKTYETTGAGSKTVLVMECDEDKVLREIQLIEKRDEEAGWRTWTVTTVVKRRATKTAPNIVGPKPKKMPRESKQSSKLVAKLVEVKGGKVSLLNRAGQPVTVMLRQLSDADHEYIREWSTGTATSPSPPSTSEKPKASLPASVDAQRADVARKNDERTRWLNETYHTIVRYVASKNVWEEVDDKTGKVNWVDRETARTDGYVELFSPERKTEIRLLDKRMEQKLDGKWQWVANGRWTNE